MSARRRALWLCALWLCACGERATPRRDLLLVSVDTLRADRLGVYAGPPGLTPHLDALASRSQIFERAFSPASYTLPAVISLLTGRLPDELGVRANVSVLRGGVPTLATRLWTRGWRTGAVVSNAVLQKRVGLHVGFDFYDDEFPDWERNRRVPERTAADTTDAALAMLAALREGGDSPVFLWVHYQDPHGPYAPPEGERERFLDRERERPDGGRRLPIDESGIGEGGIPVYQQLGDAREVAFYRAGYDGEVHYVDREVGRLLREASAEIDLDEAVVVFTADHGESLGEGEYWFAHGEYLTEPVVRIPLLVRAPDLPPGRRQDVASLVDLVPTLTRLVGAGAPGDTSGRDLFAVDAEQRPSRVPLTTGRISRDPREGLVADGFRYLVSETPEGPRESLYRLGRDDEEIGAEHPEALASLREELGELRRRHRAVAEQVQVLTREEREQLRALGYLDPVRPPASPPSGRETVADPAGRP